jgi:protocatechuate 3,4-dioxygenase beta subunit
VELSDANGTIGSTTTDSHGLYSFTGVVQGTYAAKPVDTGFTFSSVSKTVKVDADNVRGQNFLATAH